VKEFFQYDNPFSIDRIFAVVFQDFKLLAFSLKENIILVCFSLKGQLNILSINWDEFLD